MGFANLAIAGAAIYGAVTTSNAASDASDAQIGASNRASALSRDQYNQQRQDQAPWHEAGIQALGQIQQGDFNRDFSAGDFQADPGYQFRMAEGQKAIERAAAARGSSLGGATMKALTRYSQDTASQEYANAYNRFNNDRTGRFNRLSSIAGLGQTSTAQIGQASQNYANQAGQNIMGAGNAQAAGYIGQANATNNLIGQGANTWMQMQMMNRFAPQQSQTPTPAVQPVNLVAPAAPSGGGFYYNT